MSENRRRHVQALYGFDAVVHRVSADRWDHPTPCDDWTARQVVSHLVFILPMWIGRTAPIGDELGLADQDPVTVWTGALHRHLADIDHEAELDQEVSTNMGPMPLDTSLGIVMIDPLLHAWDLANATGTMVHLPPDLCEVAYNTLSFARDSIGNMFKPGVRRSSDLIEDQLLAISGRDPGWRQES